MVRDWVFSPSTKKTKMVQDDKGITEKSANPKQSKSKRSIDFNNENHPQSIMQTHEKDILPGDKRLASTPEDQTAFKRTALNTDKGETFINDIMPSPNELSITSILKTQ